MWIMTIAAGHAVCVHPALQEGTQLIHLVSLLAIGEVQLLAQTRDIVRVEEATVVIHSCSKSCAARMALRADRQFPFGVERRATKRVARRRDAAPSYPRAFIKSDDQSMVRDRLAGLLVIGPGNMIRTGSVA